MVNQNALSQRIQTNRLAEEYLFHFFVERKKHLTGAKRQGREKISHRQLGLPEYSSYFSIITLIKSYENTPTELLGHLSVIRVCLNFHY